MYPAHKTIRVSITTPDGELLDSFPVCHWRTDIDDDDVENVGSHASNSGLVERIARYVAPPVQGKDPTCVLCDAGEDHEH